MSILSFYVLVILLLHFLHEIATQIRFIIIIIFHVWQQHCWYAPILIFTSATYNNLFNKNKNAIITHVIDTLKISEWNRHVEKLHNWSYAHKMHF